MFEVYIYCAGRIILLKIFPKLGVPLKGLDDTEENIDLTSDKH